MSKEIKNVPFRAVMSNSISPSKIAFQFEQLLNEVHEAGWEYKSVNDVNVEISAGCLGSIFGNGNTYTTYDIITFEKLTPLTKVDQEKFDREEQVSISSLNPILNEYRERQEIDQPTIPKVVSENIESNSEKDAATRDSLSPTTESSKYKKWLSPGLVIGAFLLLLYFGLQKSDNSIKTIPKKEISIEILIKDFKELYKLKEYGKANEVLKQIEERSPESNFAISARKAINTKL